MAEGGPRKDPSRIIDDNGSFYVYSTGSDIPGWYTDGRNWHRTPVIFPNGIPADVHNAVPLNDGSAFSRRTERTTTPTTTTTTTVIPCWASTSSRGPVAGSHTAWAYNYFISGANNKAGVFAKF